MYKAGPRPTMAYVCVSLFGFMKLVLTETPDWPTDYYLGDR